MSRKTKATATKEDSKSELVPKLRFPEFRGTEGWKAVALQEASVPVTERVGKRKLTPVSISAGLGFVPQAEKFGRDISGNQYELYTLVSDGDFVYNKGNSLKFPQGCVYLLQGWGKVAAPNVFISFRLKDGFSNVFFQNCFEQNMHGRQLKKHITSGARSNGLLNISKEDFFGIEIATPRHAEQQKIADCLNSLDEVIAAQARKLDALKAHKKGLMQQLFPGEGETQPRLRFPDFQKNGEWEEKKLGDLVEVASGQVDPTQPPYRNSPQIGSENIESNTGKLVNVKSAGEKGVISGNYAFDENDILYSKIRPALNKVAAPEFKGICSADIYPVRPVNGELLRSYLLYLLLSQSFLKYAIRNSERGKIPKINRDALLTYETLIPSPEEQQRIASCLSGLDALIATESTKLEALKRHKRGLLQQLFPSSEHTEA